MPRSPGADGVALTGAETRAGFDCRGVPGAELLVHQSLMTCGADAWLLIEAEFRYF
ncbi:hypothetical protein ATI53_101547 [Salipiger aestuarii]|uniref:Uncharacterized protein n=1 Tax=Salipiger aestuarii TaxID=568098 RepID=A0A327YFL1_9RHOB|nr:hypothetical protein ATI53_101547 [Salipiger aestuarii]